MSESRPPIRRAMIVAELTRSPWRWRAPCTPGRPGRCYRSPGMSERSRRIEVAYAALGSGDMAPFVALLAPEATWAAVPGGGWSGQTPT